MDSAVNGMTGGLVLNRDRKAMSLENSNAGVHGEIAITPVVPAIPPGLGTQSLHLYDRSDTVLIPSPGFGASTPNQSPIVDAAGETGRFTGK